MDDLVLSKNEFVKDVIMTALQLDESDMFDVNIREYFDGFVLEANSYLYVNDDSEESIVNGIFVDEKFVMFSRLETYKIYTVMSKTFLVNIKEKLIEKYGLENYNNIKFDFYFVIKYKVNNFQNIKDIYYSTIITL